MKNLLLLFLLLIAPVAGYGRVLVILVNFTDNQAQPFSTEQVNTVNETVNAFYLENSYGQKSFDFTVTGWHTIPLSASTCDLFWIATYAQQAATTAGYDLSVYEHQVYAFPANACTGWTGSGSIGTDPYGQVYLNNYYIVPSLAHELAHNLGIHHSRSLSSEYGDVFDIMGGGSTYHFNLFQKEYLGWVVPQLVTQNGTYRIDNYEPIGGTKGLKVLKSIGASGERIYYYVEKRSPYGFDAPFANMTAFHSGVLIHQGSNVNFRDIFLLDMTPETPSMYDAELSVGQTFSDGNGVAITVNSYDAAGADIEIDIGAVPTPTPTPVCLKYNRRGQCVKWAN